MNEHLSQMATPPMIGGSVINTTQNKQADNNMHLQTVSFTLLLCSAFLQALSSGYMVYHVCGEPSSRSQHSSAGARKVRSKPLSRLLSLFPFGSDMSVPIESASPYYREPTYSLVRNFDDMVDRQFSDFDDFFLGDWRPSNSMMMPFRFSASTSIDIDVKENPKEYVLRADVPGVKKQDIQLTVSQGVLEISAERKSEGTSDDGSFTRQERSYGKISRSLRLPDGIDEDRIRAQYQDGVISLTIPKKPNMEVKPKVKKIDIASTNTVTGDVVASNGVNVRSESNEQVSGDPSLAIDVEGSGGLRITEDDKLPTDGPIQDNHHEPTLVHSSYA